MIARRGWVHSKRWVVMATVTGCGNIPGYAESSRQSDSVTAQVAVPMVEAYYLTMYSMQPTCSRPRPYIGSLGTASRRNVSDSQGEDE